ncbi:uncharacterized protein [Physcomitrium patens]|uniref:uncharacterized protein isoform X2 n=1 Tax=Physcomitrium patens TaxID=3218 RepID=UPI003CCE0C1D
MRRVYHPPRRVPHLGTSLRTGSSPGNAAFLLLPLCLCFRFLLPFSGRLKGVGFLLGSTCFAIAGSSMPFLPTFLQHLWNKLMKFFQKTGGFYIAGRIMSDCFLNQRKHSKFTWGGGQIVEAFSNADKIRLGTVHPKDIIPQAFTGSDPIKSCIEMRLVSTTTKRMSSFHEKLYNFRLQWLLYHSFIE